MADNFTLYIDSNHTSPYALFTYMALKEKGLPFDKVLINIREKHHKLPQYQSLSLTGKVPTLVQGDFALAESSAIIEYLEDAFPPPQHPALLPRDLRHRARARQLQAWLRSSLLALREERPTTIFFDQKTQVEAPLSEAAQKDADKLIEVAQALVGDGLGYLFGDWSIADTELALMLNRLLANNDPVPETVNKYARNQWQRPSLQAWLRKQP
ncbi:MAG: glutathione S-transferase [Burkholderiaceae bacterium]|nr:glutathione S-transferase [Burkholderiaceae bacterium]